jgi:TPR repeat protein
MSAQEILSRALSAKGRGLLVAGVLGLGLAVGGQAFAATSGCGEDYYDGLRSYDAGNRDAAIQIWQRSALTGDVRSQNRLGEIYEDPKSDDHILINFVEAHKWYNLAANNDLQVCSGDFGSKEARAARDHAKESRDRIEDKMTARGIGEAQIGLVDIYECKGGARDLYQLGMIYQSGTGLLQSSLDACRYFAVAAAKGDQAAKDRLDVLNDVLKREQIENCQREAAKWTRPGADICVKGLSTGTCKGSSQVPWQNRQAALRSLGFYHGRVDGAVGSGTRSAVRAYQRSLKADSSGSLTEPQICTLIEQAASNGDGVSQATLGEMYYSGIGKTKNAESAVQWLKKAAERGVPGALYRLGTMYATGSDGVDRDLAYGCKLLRDADAAGHPGAQRELDRYCD